MFNEVYQTAIKELEDLSSEHYLDTERLYEIMYRVYGAKVENSSLNKYASWGSIQHFMDLMTDDKPDQAVINLILLVYPECQYGFNMNPSIPPDKKTGRQKCAQGWVRVKFKEFNPIDCSYGHKFSSIAMLIALFNVIMHEIQLRETF